MINIGDREQPLIILQNINLLECILVLWRLVLQGKNHEFVSVGGLIDEFVLVFSFIKVIS